MAPQRQGDQSSRRPKVKLSRTRLTAPPTERPTAAIESNMTEDAIIKLTVCPKTSHRNRARKRFKTYGWWLFLATYLGENLVGDGVQGDTKCVSREKG